MLILSVVSKNIIMIYVSNLALEKHPSQDMWQFQITMATLLCIRIIRVIYFHWFDEVRVFPDAARYNNLFD